MSDNVFSKTVDALHLEASGALFSRFTLGLLTAGVRVAALPILEEQLQSFARTSGPFEAYASQTRRERHDD